MLWKRMAGTVGFAMLLVFLGFPSPAVAVDDYLVLSSPQRHAETDLQPGWVTLVFRTKANAELAKIVVLDASGRNVTTGALIVEDTNVTTQLELDLPKGTYTVMYRTSGADERVRGGAFQFAYGEGKWTSEQREVWIGEAEQPTVLADPEPEATVTPSAVPTPTVSVSVDPTPSPSATSATFVPTPASGTGSGALLGWVAGGVVLVGAVGAGAWLWSRRRQG